MPWYAYETHSHHNCLYNWSPLPCCLHATVLKKLKAKVMAYTAIASYYYMVSMMHINAKDTPTNNTDYNCLIKL